ncbi:MAG: hypothetical protein ACOZDY_18550 [Pseudomonadota bacterium]
MTLLAHGCISAAPEPHLWRDGRHVVLATLRVDTGANGEHVTVRLLAADPVVRHRLAGCRVGDAIGVVGRQRYVAPGPGEEGSRWPLVEVSDIVPEAVLWWRHAGAALRQAGFALGQLARCLAWQVRDVFTREA